MLAWQAAPGRRRKAGNSAVGEGEKQEGMRWRLSWSSVWVAAKERRRRSGLDREGESLCGMDGWAWLQLNWITCSHKNQALCTARPLIFFPVRTPIQTLTGVQSKQK
jgi:hypothetical protein